jgi:hypothetical protein
MTDECKAKLLAACRRVCESPEDDEAIRDVFEVVFECPVMELPDVRFGGEAVSLVQAMQYAIHAVIP